MGNDLQDRSRNLSYSAEPVFSNQNNQFGGLDIVKFICAYLICLIHFPIFSVASSGFQNQINLFFSQYLCRLAIPFYFTCSGFLLFRKMNIKELNLNRIKTYCFRILRLLGTWTVILFVGGTVQLWYLGALVVAVSLLTMLIKSGMRIRYIVLISVCLYAIGLLGDSYKGFLTMANSSTVEKIISAYDMFFDTTRNGLFMGFIFVLMGAIMSNIKIKINAKISFFGFLISMILLYFEKMLTKELFDSHSSNMYILLVPTAFFLLSFVTNIKVKNIQLCKTLRNIGVLIFYLQFFVSYFVLLALEILNYKFQIDLMPYYTLFIIFFVSLLSIAIEYLSRLKRFHILKYLYY